MIKNAVISPCGRFRYWLERRWGNGAYLLFVMLNPSTADANDDDPTIRRDIRFARDHGFHGIQVVNLFAYRATDPRDLIAAGCPIGPENNQYILNAVKFAGAICVAWGDRARGMSRASDVLDLIREAGRSVYCLSVTKHGEPSHPLMLPASCRLTPYRRFA